MRCELAGLCTSGSCSTDCRGLVGSVTASIVIIASVILLLGVTWFVHKCRGQRKWSREDAASNKLRTTS
uniref:Uncharacterized protein n=1 Tax=Oryza nivara TaxID=4536 RepID=A0A0E0I3S3_ORYNI